MSDLIFMLRRASSGTEKELFTAAVDAIELRDKKIQAMESVLATIGKTLNVQAGNVPALLKKIDGLTDEDKQEQ